MQSQMSVPPTPLLVSILVNNNTSIVHQQTQPTIQIQNNSCPVLPKYMSDSVKQVHVTTTTNPHKP